MNLQKKSSVRSDGTGSGIAAKKWATGNQNTAYFNGGTVGNNLSANGTYTVYAKDNAGHESVQTITISNIDRTPPVVVSVRVNP